MRPIKEVLESKNIAVFGASRNPMKPGALLIATLMENGFKGRIAGINTNGGEFRGVPFYRTIKEVPFDVDLVSMIIPPSAVPEALRACAAKGVKGVVISSEGFSESGEAGRAIQEEIRSILHESGMRGFGPNTLGLVNTETGMTTSYFANRNMLTAGSVGFAAQSGIFVGALLMHMGAYPVYRISKGLGLGNKVDVDESDAMEYLAADKQTRIIGMYLEDIRDGSRFFKAARMAVRRKPVILLKGGRSKAGGTATTSHTASMAVNDAVLDGAMRQAGVLRAKKIDEMLSMIMGFQWSPLPRGNRIAIVTFSGAQAIMSIDRASETGLALARFSPGTMDRLAAVLSTVSKRKNPVDIYPDMNVYGFEKMLFTVLEALFDDEGVDGILFVSSASYAIENFRPLSEMIREKANKPVFVSLLGDPGQEADLRSFLMEQKIPVFNYPETGIEVFASMLQYAKHAERK
ncbi:MAG: acetate--CoA ligase family protein [Desulfobacterales bacterium]